MSNKCIYRKYVKRITDLIAASVLLILFLPIFLLLALLIAFFMGRPIFFTQKRPGFQGLPFLLLKFRTMDSQLSQSGELTSDIVRITTLGKYLRRFSLDELPQLVNIFFGEMSFIGPRPLLMEYLPLYSTFQSRRHEVLPGITGWAQIRGRNQIDWLERFKCDVWYVDNQSFYLDLKIALLTVQKVISAKGVNVDEMQTMNKFTGNH